MRRLVMAVASAALGGVLAAVTAWAVISEVDPDTRPEVRHKIEAASNPLLTGERVYGNR